MEGIYSFLKCWHCMLQNCLSPVVINNQNMYKVKLTRPSKNYVLRNMIAREFSTWMLKKKMSDSSLHWTWSKGDVGGLIQVIYWSALHVSHDSYTILKLMYLFQCFVLLRNLKKGRKLAINRECEIRKGGKSKPATTSDMALLKFQVENKMYWFGKKNL